MSTLITNEMSIKSDDSNKLFMQPSVEARKITSRRANPFGKHLVNVALDI